MKRRKLTVSACCSLMVFGRRGILRVVGGVIRCSRCGLLVNVVELLAKSGRG